MVIMPHWPCWPQPEPKDEYQFKCIFCGKTGETVDEPPKGIKKIVNRMSPWLRVILGIPYPHYPEPSDVVPVDAVCEECRQRNSGLLISEREFAEAAEEVKAFDQKFCEAFPHDIKHYREQSLRWSKLCCRSMLREKLHGLLSQPDSDAARCAFYEEIGLGEVMNVEYYAGTRAARLRRHLGELIRLHALGRCVDAEWQTTLDKFLDTATAMLHKNGLWDAGESVSLQAIEDEFKAYKAKLVSETVPLLVPAKAGRKYFPCWYNFTNIQHKLFRGSPAHDKLKALLARFPRLK